MIHNRNKRYFLPHRSHISILYFSFRFGRLTNRGPLLCVIQSIHFPVFLSTIVAEHRSLFERDERSLYLVNVFAIFVQNVQNGSFDNKVKFALFISWASFYYVGDCFVRVFSKVVLGQILAIRYLMSPIIIYFNVKP